MIIYKVCLLQTNHPAQPKQRVQSLNAREFSTADYWDLQDIVTGDEVISDSYDIKEVDDTVYEIDCKKITLGADNFGWSSPPIQCSRFRALGKSLTSTPFADTGANPSAEEADEGLEEGGGKQVIDIVNAFRLNFLGDEASGTRAFGTKKDFQGQLKGR